MESTTLQPNTILALRNFLSIWRQDPAAQYHLGISSQNVILWDAQNPEQVIDVTPTEEPDPSNELNELLRPFDEDIEALLAPAPSEKPKAITQLLEDLTQTLNPQKAARTNPFLRETWTAQVDKILQELPKFKQSRRGQIQAIEAHYYLGTIIEKQTEHRTQIREQIRKIKGERKTQDIWKGAQRIRKIFTVCPKDLIHQTKHLSMTQIIKLKDEDYTLLIEELEKEFTE